MGTYTNAQGYGLGAQAVALAARYIGVPYLWGGTTPKGFDCSGLVQFVYGLTGVKLPRTSEEQAKIGISVPYSQAQPGDLLIYSYSTPSDHVGIYAGGGQQIDAPKPGRTVEQAAVDTAHLTSVIRPFTGGGTSSGTAVQDVNDFTSVGSDVVSSLSSLAIKSTFVAAAVGLVALGLWRGTTTSDA